MDRVLGGGLVPGSVVLVGGEPGIGKSTLLLQVADRLSERVGSVLYVSAEESAQQVKMRADRLNASAPGLFLLPETSLENILEAAKARDFGAIVVDSIQAIASADSPAAAGSVTQVRACASSLLVLAKTTGVPVFLIGHVTKDGTLAGPKTLEHLVDAVLSFEGEHFHAHRVVRALKNRFGPVHELGIFEMTGAGLVEVANPSALYLGSGAGGRPGSVVLAGVEGTRPLLLEVQALTVEAKYGSPRRTAIGFDGTRLPPSRGPRAPRRREALLLRRLFERGGRGRERRARRRPRRRGRRGGQLPLPSASARHRRVRRSGAPRRSAGGFGRGAQAEGSGVVGLPLGSHPGGERGGGGRVPGPLGRPPSERRGIAPEVLG